MLYTHTTFIQGEPSRTREITEAQMIGILSNAMLLLQVGGPGSVELRRVEDPEDGRLIRYEMTTRSPFRNSKGPAIIIHHYTPNGDVYEDD